MDAKRDRKVSAAGESIVADYTEAVVPESAKRSHLRVFLLFMSMQLVFGTVLVAYGASYSQMEEVAPSLEPASARG